MKELDDLVNNVSETFKALTRLIEKVDEELEKITSKEQASPEPMIKATAEPEKKTPARKETPKKQGAKSKSVPVNASKRKPDRPQAGITETLQKAIQENPGISFKSLQEKTGFETKQIRNALPPLKKSGKIKSEGKGVYFPGPVSTPE